MGLSDYLAIGMFLIALMTGFVSVYRMRPGAIKDLSETVTQLSGTVNEQTRTIDLLKGQVDHLEDELSKKDAEILTLQKELQKVQEDLEQETRRRREAESSVQTFEKRLTAAFKKIDKLEVENESIKLENSKLNGMLEMVRDRLGTDELKGLEK